MQVKQLPRRKPRKMYADGGEMMMDGEGTPGGMIQGPTHEQGGVPATDAATGEQVAEVEGGERIFSQEDTAQIEQIASQVMELQQKSPQKADQLATELGYMIVEMIMKQEQNQQLQEQGMGGEQDMANEFANSPE